MTSDAPTNTPDWYEEEIEKLREGMAHSEIDIAALLTATRQEFYDSLATFYAQVRHLISLYIAVFVALGFVLGEIEELPRALVASSGFLLILVAGISFFAYKIITAQYSLYVSGVVYSAQLHAAMNLDTHYWFDEVKVFKQSALDKGELITRWMWQDDSTAKSYFLIIVLFTLAACVAGIALVSWAVFR